MHTGFSPGHSIGCNYSPVYSGEFAGGQGDPGLHPLGYIAAYKGDPSAAEAQFRESLAMFRKLGNKRGIAECIAGLASLRAKAGKLQAGAELLGAAEALLGASGAAWWPADRVEVERNRQLLQAALAQDEFATAWETGAAMTIDQAIEFALDE